MHRAMAELFATHRICIRAGLALAASLVAITAASGGDVALGRYLANECLTCHSSALAGNTIPDIFGAKEAYLVEAIKAYRAKSLPNPVMQNVASRLKDDEIEALASYFAATKRPK